jgi:hypothetical protein
MSWSVLDHARDEAQVGAAVDADEFELRRVEAQVVQPPQPLVDPEGLVDPELLGEGQLGPQP